MDDAIAKCKSLDEMIALADSIVFIDDFPVNLGQILISDNHSIKTVTDLMSLTIVLDEMVLGDQGQILNRMTYVEGKTTYVYDFETNTTNTSTEGNIFSHDKGAVVEVIYENAEKPVSEKNNSFTEVGEIEAFSPNTLYRFVTVKFSPRGKAYEYLCDDMSVKAGDIVIIDGYKGLSELEVLAVTDKRAGDLLMPISKYKKIEGKK